MVKSQDSTGRDASYYLERHSDNWWWIHQRWNWRDYHERCSPQCKWKATIDEASTLSGTVAIVDGYTNGGSGATITDDGDLSVNGASTLQDHRNW